MTTNNAKDYGPHNIYRSVEHVRTGEVAEFIGCSPTPGVINIATLDGREIAAYADDWDLVY